MSTGRTSEQRGESNRLVTCAWRGCTRLFSACGSCDRGRRYCSCECAMHARRAQLRQAGRVYQASERGRRAHASRQARYRTRVARVTHRRSADERKSREISLGSIRTANALFIRDSRPSAESVGRAADPASAGAACPLECALCGRRSVFLRVGFRRRRAPRCARQPGQRRTAPASAAAALPVGALPWPDATSACANPTAA
jgi:hypothetical protein